MKIINKYLPADANVILFGDDHFGNKFRSVDAHDNLLNAMKEPYKKCRNNYLIHSGDIIEAIVFGDKRSSPETKDSMPLEQMEEAYNYYYPIRKKIITILEGNHPRKLWGYGPVTENICKKLGVIYGSWTCIINYLNEKTNDLMFKQFATHGSKAFNSSADDSVRAKSNMLLSLKRSMRHKASDCLVMSCGHSHKLMVLKPVEKLILGTTLNGKLISGYTNDIRYDTSICIPEDQRYYVNTGSSVRLYTPNSNCINYAEIAGYDPIELGYAVMLIRGGKLVDIDLVVFDI